MVLSTALKQTDTKTTKFYVALKHLKVQAILNVNFARAASTVLPLN